MKETGDATRRAPVQSDERDKPPSRRTHGPGTISWKEHLEIWDVYARKYGKSQSAERLAQRGGFGYDEITLLTGKPPSTWEPE